MLDNDEVTTAGSASWWLLRLGAQLDADRAGCDYLHNYDIGNHPMPEGHQKAKAGFQRFQKMARTNFVGLVAEAVLDRLQIDGFRMGGQADLEADKEAMRIWQANSMDADASVVMRDALVMRRSYVIVGPDPDTEGGVILTAEDPRNVIHAADPCNRRRVRAALKTWDDEIEKKIYAVVYLPEEIHYFVAARSEHSTRWAASVWSYDENEGEGGVAANPTAPIVPVVPFINRPEKDRMGFGEAQDVIDIQDRINQTTLDRLATGATQAFRQRWAVGVDLDKDQFDPGADLLWSVEADGAEFGEFQVADLRQFLEAAKGDTEQLASISRTPPYYLLGAMANLSGDALTAAEAGLVAKARRRMGQFGESWEAVLGLAFSITGREIAVDAETIWADPERHNEAASADAAVKKKDVGVPWRQLMEDLGYSPQQIDRMDVLRTAEEFRDSLNQPEEEATAPAAPAAPELAPGQTEATLTAKEKAELIQKVYLGVDVVVTRNEARDLLRQGQITLGPDDDFEEPAPPPAPVIVPPGAAPVPPPPPGAEGEAAPPAPPEE